MDETKRLLQFVSPGAEGRPGSDRTGHRVARESPAADAEQGRIPDGVDDAAVRGALLDEFNIEIGGGLGPLKGKTWRIGLMGESSTTANVLLVLSALERVLPRYGHTVSAGAAVAAAERVYAERG